MGTKRLPPSRRAQFLARLRNNDAFWIVANWAVQLALAVIGAVAIVDDGLEWLRVWCIGGSVYAALAAAVLGLRARWPGRSSEPASRLWIGWWRVPVAWFFTLIPAAIGVVVALQLIVVNKAAAADDTWELKVLGVWAMFLGWVFMHWGMAQIYQLRSEMARPDKVLDFPGTPRPGLVDHVYFAFTMGTTFAASDVTVLDTRLRWLVTVHSVVSFAMNALVIALAFNTIMNGGK